MATVVGVAIALAGTYVVTVSSHAVTLINGTSVQDVSPMNSMLNVRRPFGSAAVFTDVTLTVGIVMVTVEMPVFEAV